MRSPTMRNLLALFVFFAIFSCRDSYEETYVSLEEYQMEKGFELEVLAAEPLLKAPVAMDFDNQGRMWVAQMPGYMNDMQGSDEDKPVGSIVILEDLDNDGVADHSKIFLDSLVMPRALTHVYGGLLYSEPPFLYFVDIENDQPKNHIVVDSVYAADGNPEHQPNGLLLNVDNWIYNAKSNFRYRRDNGVWKKEPTTFRGQWGISHDNFGRLYYNNNSRQLLGDYVLPNRVIRNKHFTPKRSVNRMLTEDQRVYPLHPTTVNRGYSPGTLNADSILVNVTAAAGLSVYRGGSFPEGYDQNVFVSIPEGNLIKRNILAFRGDSTIAVQAWEDKEFLASTDEGFRPVSLKNGPDGGLYIIDMHRGMIGHHAYLSPYLKKKNEVTRLDTLTDYGRILRVKKSETKHIEMPNFDAFEGHDLVKLLSNKNGWIRDRAQHLLIFNQRKEILPELKNLAVNTKNALAQIHALYTLEGLNALDFDLLSKAATISSPNVAAHAIVLSERFVFEENIIKAQDLFKTLISKNDVTIDLYLSSTLGKWKAIDEIFFRTMMTIFNRHKGNHVFEEAILSGLEGQESSFSESLAFMSSFSEPRFMGVLDNIMENQKEKRVNPIFSRKSINEDNRTAGAKMFYQICASCHGSNGQGIEGLAPPLMKSEHVEDSERLTLIILHGLQGPIAVNGEKYEFNLAMPGLIHNDKISDKDIADIVAYVSNAFSDTPKAVKKERVAELRILEPKSEAEYTIEELINFIEK